MMTMPTRARRPAMCVATVATCLLVIGLVSCSSSGTSAGPADTGSAARTPTTRAHTTRAHAVGTKATLTALRGGHGAIIAEPTTDDLAKAGYAQREYAAAGTATSYRAKGALSGDGRWTLAPDATAAYRTRVLVRAPSDPKKFSGTVVVEWLNVSGGIDADPDWVSLREEIERAGDVWVGVSAQKIGVEGGAVAVKATGPGAEDQGKGLKTLDPARYGSLSHPGDGYAFDIFTQVANAVRDGAALHDLTPKWLLAAGESQSAFALVTYINGVQPLADTFDGFFVHSRGAAPLPLAHAGASADIAGSISGTPTIFRTDQTVPVLDIQTETDVSSIINSYAARQPDNAHFRLWEVAGTAHADAHLVGPSASSLDCGVPINNGAMHIVAKAALRALTTWVSTGTPPVTAPRIEASAGSPAVVDRDADGIAKGGIRTPPVDVPVDALSGQPGPNPSVICLLLGSTKPLSAARLAQLYPSRASYLRRYRADVSATIKAGFALPEDRAALLDFAEPGRVAS